jgi:predicted O-methyltransferase YrrM
MEIKNYITTNNWFDYQNFYSEIAKNKYKILVEVGVWKGHSISFLSKKLKEQDYDFDLYGVDLFEQSEIYKNDGNEYLSEQIPIIWEIYNYNLEINGVRNLIKDIKDYSWEASKKFEDRSVDFVFLDADHSYESVKKDIESWLPKIKTGGMIAGHDYYNPCGVKRAVDELLPDMKINSDKIWTFKIK